MNVAAEEVQGRWVELKDRAVFRLSGPDRVRYLNGQLTNDVSKLNGTNTLPACVCTLKGRVEFLVWITEHEGCLLIDGQIDQREELFARLDRYLIADDCELTDETGNYRIVHHFDSAEKGTDSRRLSVPGKDLWLEAGSELPFDSGAEIKACEWKLLSLRSLVPESPFEVTGNEFPAELGLDDWAVDFHKGCYLGQEVVSRIESVGRVKRALSLIVASTPFKQNAALRNEVGEEIRPTRDSEEISQENFVGMAFVSATSKEGQGAFCQRVT